MRENYAGKLSQKSVKKFSLCIVLCLVKCSRRELNNNWIQNGSVWCDYRNGNRATEISENIYICWGVPRFLLLYPYLCFSSYTPHWPLILTYICSPFFWYPFHLRKCLLTRHGHYLRSDYLLLSLCYHRYPLVCFSFNLHLNIRYPRHLIESSSLSDILK